MPDKNLVMPAAEKTELLLPNHADLLIPELRWPVAGAPLFLFMAVGWWPPWPWTVLAQFMKWLPDRIVSRI